MTANIFLDCLKEFTEKALKNLKLPAKPTKEEPNPEDRCPGIYRMRLPHMNSSDKKAPYIIHQIITTNVSQQPGNRISNLVTVRSIFCAYNEDEEEGGCQLLEMQERLRIAMNMEPIIGKYFVLQLDQGLETMTYPDETAPFYLGEMKSVWSIPPVERNDVAYVFETQGNGKRQVAAGDISQWAGGLYG